jgi:hypothetical protein
MLYTNATIRLYEGDIALTDGIASRDEVNILRYRIRTHADGTAHEIVTQERVPTANLMPPTHTVTGIAWSVGYHMAYGRNLDDARAFANLLAARYGYPFGVYDAYSNAGALMYVVTAAMSEEYESITCYYRTDEK